MSAFWGLVILSFVLFACLLSMLLWSIRSGQMDDLESPAERILWDDHHEL